MDLPTLWFLLIAFFWAGYLVLEGFDFGVGMLLPFVARDADDRRVAVGTFGPVWDANEVWLLVAGASMFAAFPNWYASMFHALYLPLTLLLVALIVRVLAIEYRTKQDDPRWTARWDRALIVTSYVAPIAIALALANVVRGIPLDGSNDYTGNLLDLVHPYGLLGAAAVVALYLLHGATFLGIRAEGPVRERARATATRVAPVAIVLAAAFGTWTVLGVPLGDATTSPVAVVALVVAAGALVTATVAVRAGREGIAFAGTTVAILGVAILMFAQLWPNVLPSTDVVAGTLTVDAAASSPYTLKVMSFVALTMVPVVLAYQAWSYWVFRHRVRPTGDASPLQALARRRAAEG
ncbi:MAG: cytochrome d ubiquinol oxidase subunit II [Solirubrobacteraceae bacterium]|nr:cytochrome d ubiquinol oxidase subunit II [Solirubrobacteraceae bacterium]